MTWSGWGESWSSESRWSKFKFKGRQLYFQFIHFVLFCFVSILCLTVCPNYFVSLFVDWSTSHIVYIFDVMSRVRLSLYDYMPWFCILCISANCSLCTCYTVTLLLVVVVCQRSALTVNVLIPINHLLLLLFVSRGTLLGHVSLILLRQMHIFPIQIPCFLFCRSMYSNGRGKETCLSISK